MGWGWWSQGNRRVDGWRGAQISQSVFASFTEIDITLSITQPMNITKDFILQSSTPEGLAPLPFAGTLSIVFVSCALGLAWAAWNWFDLTRIKTDNDGLTTNSSASTAVLNDVGNKIAEGAKEFLKQQYAVCLAFVLLMFFVIYGAVEKFHAAYTAFAFVIGAITSMGCGAIGMLIATYSNYRTAFKARSSLEEGFKVAYQAGSVMGFALVSISLMILTLVILIFRAIMTRNGHPLDIQALFESVAGYGLGGSTVALFARVGGGIYTKAADVGADLVGKVEQNLPEDSPRNPATIADNVGDNVGDIAGMGADLFGSFAEATCAAFVISSTNLIGSDQHGEITFEVEFSNLFLPLVSTSVGIFCCILTSFVGIYVVKVDVQEKIERALKYQLIISTGMLLLFLAASTYLCLPDEFVIRSSNLVRSPGYAYLCQIFGLLSGMVIGAFTEFMTSHSYSPVREVAASCRTGAATNIIYGLALGYMSTVVPAVLISVTAYAANYWLGYYGIALSALGMLSNLPIGLAIDGYGPISDNAGGIAEMAALGEETRQRTDALDAAGNTTAAIGKGFAIGSAALVALALYGGFIHNAELEGSQGVQLTSPVVFTGMLLGAMMPFVFSALTMKSVGKAALGMVEEVRRQIRESPGILTGVVEPDYKACIRISTRASLKEMIAPGLLVILTPLLLGIAFGPEMIAGFLPGAIISGVQMAISSANTGGAWDNAKKYIESGMMEDEEGRVIKKGSEIHKAAVIGDTVGDPLKDTSGPSINILIKLMAILSLIFADMFHRIHK